MINRLLLSICFCIFINIFFSCNKQTKHDDLIGKQLNCDSLLVIKGKKVTNEMGLSSDGLSVFLWIDSTKCIPCEMNYLYGLESFSNRCEYILGQGKYLFVVISPGKSYGIDNIVKEIENQNYSFNLFVDTNNTLDDIFNCDNRMLLITKDGLILKYYAIDNNSRRQSSFYDCINYLEKLSLRQE